MDIIVFILSLGIIITLHEFGHLIAAKIFGVYCREFSIGFGPKLFSYKGKETEYFLRIIPIGGYVAMAGEPNEDDLMPDNLPFERTLPGIKPLKRIVIYLAGIFMNIVLFIVSFTILFNVVGIEDTRLTTSTISFVQEGSPAQKAGVLVGDTITQVIINDRAYEISDYETLSEATSGNSDPLTYVVDRNGESLNFDLVPKYDEETDRYLVGVAFSAPAKKLNLLDSFTYSIQYTWTYTVLIVKTLGNLFIGKGLDQVGGPVAIYRETAKVADMGIVAIIAWIGQLSLNVGIFNAIPIPALDGGRVILTFAEMVMGRPVNKKIETVLITASFILMLGLIVLVMINDIVGLF